MSERDLQRIEVLAEVAAKRRTVVAAAAVLALSVRQVRRLLRAYRRGGGAAIAHKARGRPSNNRIQDAVRDRGDRAGAPILRRFRPDAGGGDAGREARPDGLARDVARLDARGGSVAARASSAASFISRGCAARPWASWCRSTAASIAGSRIVPSHARLLVFIDDATGRLMQLRFVPSESAFAYFEALQGYLEAHGCPVAFYSDKHSVFRVARKEAKGGQGMTQFGRALAELNIEILCANSSQAKGRVERVNRTLQDRLVKELRLAGISDDRGRQRVPAGLHGALQRPLRRCARPVRAICTGR